MINVPELPAMVVDSPIDISISAWPYKEFELKIRSDRAMQIIPSSVMFSNAVTNWNISMMAKGQGLHKLDFIIDDDSLDYKPIPPVVILATKKQGCSKRRAAMLTPGCCQATEVELGLQLECPSRNGNVIFKSTCGWAANEVPPYSGGVIFSSNNGFDIPIAITGAKFQSQEDFIELDGVNFQDTCTTCNTGITAGSCDTEYTKVKDVQCYLHFDSLAVTYLQKSMLLTPKWIEVKTMQANRDYNVNSYTVKLLYSDSFDMLEECRFMTLTSTGLYSVLIYTGSLQVEVDKQPRQIQFSTSPVCFAVNLCDGKDSPLYFTIPDHAQNILQSYYFMNDLKYKGYSMEIRSVAISKSEIKSAVHQMTQQIYWNGLDFVLSQQPTPQIIADMNFTKIIFSRSAVIDLIFSGYVLMSHDNIDQVNTII